MDERSARRRDLCLTAHNTHNRQTSMSSVGLEPTISAGKRPQTYALDRAATGTGNKRLSGVFILNQINSVHGLQIYLFNIHFNNILLLICRSSRWSNSFRFRDRIYSDVSTSLLPYTCHMSR